MKTSSTQEISSQDRPGIGYW